MYLSQHQLPVWTLGLLFALAFPIILSNKIKEIGDGSVAKVFLQHSLRALSGTKSVPNILIFFSEWGRTESYVVQAGFELTR